MSRRSRGGASDRAGELVVLLLAQLVAQAVRGELDVLVGDERVLGHGSPHQAALGDAHRKGVRSPAHVVIVDQRVAGEPAESIQCLPGPEVSFRDRYRVADGASPWRDGRVAE